MSTPRLLALFVLLLTSVCASGATLNEIIQLHKKGKPGQALAELDQYLAALPKDSWGRNVTQARFLKGVILAEQKKTDEAIRIFTKLTLDYPSLPEPYNNLAALYVAQGKYEAARDTLERAMHIDQTYATLQANLNDVYAKLSAQAYDSTLGGNSKAAPERIRELCENYGKMANQVAGRKTIPRADADFRLIRDIEASRTAAAQPPAHVDIDEMAMDTPATPASRPEKPAASAAGTPPPVAKPATPAIDHAPGPVEKEAILKAVHTWSTAWSSKNVNAYLAAYAPDFRIPGGGSRSAWAAQRRERISKPKSIRVTVESPQVSMADAVHAKAAFRQTYHSDTLQSSGRKTLSMVKSGGKWLIQEEQVGG